MGPDRATGMLRVVTPILNGPAYRAGLRAGDLITHIHVHQDQGGTPLARPRVLSTRHMSVEQAEALFAGAEGTRVTLIVLPRRLSQ